MHPDYHFTMAVIQERLQFSEIQARRAAALPRNRRPLLRGIADRRAGERA